MSGPLVLDDPRLMRRARPRRWPMSGLPFAIEEEVAEHPAAGRLERVPRIGAPFPRPILLLSNRRNHLGAAVLERRDRPAALPRRGQFIRDPSNSATRKRPAGLEQRA
ncbi:hypothetical protein P4233_17165 [Pseudomonas aeruginosa]|nr:hypothetical protein [Pseudomonas aeruginosa]